MPTLTCYKIIPAPISDSSTPPTKTASSQPSSDSHRIPYQIIRTTMVDGSPHLLEQFPLDYYEFDNTPDAQTKGVLAYNDVAGKRHVVVSQKAAFGYPIFCEMNADKTTLESMFLIEKSEHTRLTFGDLIISTVEISTVEISKNDLIALCKKDNAGLPPPRLSRLYQSTFGGHPYRTTAGIVLLASFLLLLFLSPASFPLSFLGAMAFGLQNIFTGVLAKTLMATLGGFLALTAPKWIGNLLQFVGIRLWGGIVGRFNFLLSLIPYLLLALLCNLLQLAGEYAGFLKKKSEGGFEIKELLIIKIVNSLLIIPVFVVFDFGSVINLLGTIISGEPFLPLENPTMGATPSAWGKIMFALRTPLPAARTAEDGDLAIFEPERRLDVARKYDNFCKLFRCSFKTKIFANFCDAEDRKIFFSPPPGTSR